MTKSVYCTVLNSNVAKKVNSYVDMFAIEGQQKNKRACRKERKDVNESENRCLINYIHSLETTIRNEQFY